MAISLRPREASTEFAIEWAVVTQSQKASRTNRARSPFFGRDDWIRTSGLTHPKGARYQAAPRPVKTFSVWPERVFCQIWLLGSNALSAACHAAA